jgi:hypothetical protein
MPITIPKPLLLMPKVPSVAVVGLLIAQYLLLQFGHSPEPKCILNVERPHYSTSLNETRNINAIKLNITSTCNVPQKYTEISANILKIQNNQEVMAFRFESERRSAMKGAPNVAVYKNLYAPCIKGISVPYRGVVRGYVYLKNGQKYPVKGDSGNFVAEKCLIGAE